MDESSEDQRLPHHRNPQEFVSLDHLAGLISIFLGFRLFLRLFILCFVRISNKLAIAQNWECYTGT